MVFVLAIHHGARHAVASFSMAHQIGAAAWPVALVLMALLEVATRIAIVQLRGRNAMRSLMRAPGAEPVTKAQTTGMTPTGCDVGPRQPIRSASETMIPSGPRT